MTVSITEPRTPSGLDSYYELRWRLLREPWQQPRGSERDDFESSGYHLMACDETGRAVAVGRVHAPVPGLAQIRYMAVLPDYRGRGVGRSILRELEEKAGAWGATRIVLNARKPAAGFYEACGYRVTGAGPTMFGSVEHVSMEKEITSR